jgi:hypothetical protein
VASTSWRLAPNHRRASFRLMPCHAMHRLTTGVPNMACVKLGCWLITFISTPHRPNTSNISEHPFHIRSKSPANVPIPTGISNIAYHRMHPCMPSSLVDVDSWWWSGPTPTVLPAFSFLRVPHQPAAGARPVDDVDSRR